MADEVEGKGSLVGVFGPFGSRALVEVPIAVAQSLIADDVIEPAPALMVDAVRRDLDRLRERDPSLAESGLAVSMLALAFEMANPYNSATSKSMCAKALADAWNKLRDLAPPAKTKDRTDDLKDRRDERRRRAAGGSAASD